MKDVFAAFGKAGRDLTRAEILWHALWPPLVAIVLWVTIGVAVWAHGIAMLSSAIPALPWSGWEWVAHWAAVFLLVAAFAALTWFTALLLVAVVALPKMIETVAARDYPDLGRHGENVFWGSLRVTLGAGLIFLLGWIVILPLLLIPGVILVLPLLWATWLNQRTFRFDAIAEHATDAERARLFREENTRFYFAGLGSALAAHVPVLNLLAPAFTALVFVHLGLTALRRQRQATGVQL